MLRFHPGTTITRTAKNELLIRNQQTQVKLSKLSDQEAELLFQLQHLRSLAAVHQIGESLNISKETIAYLLTVLADHQLLDEFPQELGVSEVDYNPEQTADRLRAASHIQIDLSYCADEQLSDFVKVLTDLLLGKGFGSVTLKVPEASRGLLGGSLSALLRFSPQVEPDFIIRLTTVYQQIDPGGVDARNGVPVLAVVFTEDSLQVGPLLKPLDAPCYHCFELWEAEANDNHDSALFSVEFPRYPRTLLVAGAAATAEAAVSLYTDLPWVPGEIRDLDRDLIIQQMLVMPHDDCEYHLLQLPPTLA